MVDLLVETPHPQSLGQSESSVSDWDSLPPVEPLNDLPAAPPDKPDATEKVASGFCATCREPIIREPGARGRMPRYHPDCRPLRTATQMSTARRNNKAEAEADECIVMFQQAVTKACVMLSVVDRFDAFSVMVALPSICDNLRGVLIRFDSFRKEFLAAKTGGSIIGLAFAIGMLLLPILAHHGLIGRGKIAQLLVEMPFTMLKIQQRLKEGSEALVKMMEEQLRAAADANRKQAEEAAKVRQAASSGVA